MTTLQPWRTALFIALTFGALLAATIARQPAYPTSMDLDTDGAVSNEEWMEWQLRHVDTDGDGIVSRTEWNMEYLESDASMETWRKRRYYHTNVDRKGKISLEDWKTFHAIVPERYGGYDENGVISWGSPGYYDREFRRVDCNYDSEIDWYEFQQLRWNMRWCTSSLRPERPWWR